MAPGATFCASTARGNEAPPAGATIGENKSSCGGPATLPDCGVTAKATSLETIVALATQTMMVPALATSFAGTFTASTVQEPPAGQFPGVTEVGMRTAPPKFTCALVLRPVPVIVSVKLLPAGTLVGEIAAMVGCNACGGGVGGEAMEFPPPQPENNPAEISPASTSVRFLRMRHRVAPASCPMRFGWRQLDNHALATQGA